MEYDLIGDIHGQGDRLEHLLSRMGYTKTPSGYRHSGRMALFLGDLIDRGKQNRQVIDIVRTMVENGHAKAVLGNHEFNAIGFHQIDQDTGLPLRPHKEKNIKQHRTFLDEYPLGHPDTRSVIEWFKTLPMFLDMGEFRLVHACWDEESITILRPFLSSGNVLSETGLEDAHRPHTAEFKAVETLIKGPEITLPEGSQIIDKSDDVRKEVRVKWWDMEGPKTYRSVALTRTEFLERLPELPVDDFEPQVRYGADQPRVFFGHYSLDPVSQHPVQALNAICLDFSAPKDPPITAYAWNGVEGFVPAGLVQV